MFTRRNLIAAVLAALGWIASAPAEAQDGHQRWIDIINQSDVTIERFYATDVGTNSWGPDLLGQDVVAPGRRYRVEPTRGQMRRGFCQYDMKVVFANGAEREFRRVNLCEATAIVCTSTRSCSFRY